MAFYDLTKAERDSKVAEIHSTIQQSISNGQLGACVEYFSDSDTYIRKAAYSAVGKIFSIDNSFQEAIIAALVNLKHHPNELVRQTVVNAAGEIGMTQFKVVQDFVVLEIIDVHSERRYAKFAALSQGEVVKIISNTLNK